MTLMQIDILTLPAMLDMQAAPALKAALLARGAGSLVLDASAVAWLGAQCLQILLAARSHWELVGETIRIEKMSDAFAAALAGFGVTLSQLNTEYEVFT